MIIPSTLNEIIDVIWDNSVTWIGISEFELNLSNTVKKESKKWFVYFNAAKTQQDWCDCSINSMSICVKMDKSIVDKNSSIEILSLFFTSRLDLESLFLLIKLMFWFALKTIAIFGLVF